MNSSCTYILHTLATSYGPYEVDNYQRYHRCSGAARKGRAKSNRSVAAVVAAAVAVARQEATRPGLALVDSPISPYR